MGWCTCSWCVSNSAYSMRIYVWALCVVHIFITNANGSIHRILQRESGSGLVVLDAAVLLTLEAKLCTPSSSGLVPCFALIRDYNSLRSFSFGDRFPTTDWWFPLGLAIFILWCTDTQLMILVSKGCSILLMTLAMFKGGYYAFSFISGFFALFFRLYKKQAGIL